MSLSSLTVPNPFLPDLEEDAEPGPRAAILPAYNVLAILEPLAPRSLTMYHTTVYFLSQATFVTLKGSNLEPARARSMTKRRPD